jgi:hypothetical protein
MRSLLLVESFEFRPSNQYVLVRVIPSCLRFAKMCLCLSISTSRIKVQVDVNIIRSEVPNDKLKSSKQVRSEIG